MQVWVQLLPEMLSYPTYLFHETNLQQICLLCLWLDSQGRSLRVRKWRNLYFLPGQRVLWPLREPTEVTKVHIFSVRNDTGGCTRSASFLVFILLLCLRSYPKAELFFWRRLCFSRTNPSFEDLAVFSKQPKLEAAERMRGPRLAVCYISGSLHYVSLL